MESESVLQQLEALATGHSQTQTHAKFMLREICSTLSRLGIAGDHKSEAPGALQLSLKLIVNQKNEEFLDGLYFLLNHLIQRVNPAFLAQSLPKFTPKLINDLQAALHPSALLSVLSVGAQICKLDEQQPEQLLHAIVMRLFDSRTQVSQHTSKCLCQLINYEPLFAGRVSQIVLAEFASLSHEMLISFCKNATELLALFEGAQADQIIVTALLHPEPQIFFSKCSSIFLAIGSHQVAERAFKMILQMQLKSDSQTQLQLEEAALNIYQAFLRNNPLKATFYLPAWLSLMGESLTRNSERMLKLFEQVRFYDVDSDQLDLQNIQLQGPSTPQKTQTILSLMLDSLQQALGQSNSNSSALKIVLQLCTAFVKKLQKQRYEGLALKLLERVTQIEQVRRKWLVPLVIAIMNNFGSSIVFDYFPLGLEGDPGDPEFQSKNNLWLLEILAKLEAVGFLEDFVAKIVPLLERVQTLVSESVFQIKKRFLINLKERLWATFKSLSKARAISTLSQFMENTASRFESVCNDYLLQGLHSAIAWCKSNYKQQQLLQITKPAEKLITKLAKSIQQGNKFLKHSLCARALAGAASPQYVGRVFLKNIIALIANCENLPKEQKQQDKVIANLDILLAISEVIQFNDQSAVGPKGQTKLEFAFNIAKKLVGLPLQFQKRGYKLLLLLAEKISNIHNQALLQIMRQAVKLNGSVQSFRLQVYRVVWNRQACTRNQGDQSVNLILHLVKTLIPQLLVSLRVNSSKARSFAQQLISSVCNKMIALDLLEEFLQLLTVGVLGSSNLMKADSVRALTLVMERHGKKFGNNTLLRDILDICLHLFKTKAPEVVKQLVIFCKKAISILPPEIAKEAIPKITEHIFQKVDSSVRQSLRYQIKHFLLKLSKRLGQQKMEKLVPEQQMAFYRNTIKTAKRQKRKKQLLKQQKRQQRFAGKQGHQEDSDSDSGQGPQKMAIQNQQTDIAPEHAFFEGVTTKAKPKQQANPLDLTIRAQKRRRPQEEEDPVAKQTSQLNRVFKKVRTETGIHRVKLDAKVYRGHGGTDKTIAGRPLPVSFVQLNPKALNRRYSKKAAAIFEQVVGHGGLKGLKERVKKDY